VTAKRHVAWVSGLIVCCFTLPSCVQALYGYSTIEGKRFAHHRTPDVVKGQTSEQVRSILGDPFEITERNGVVVWRYFEKFYPRGCETELFGMSLSSRRPESVQAIVSIREGIVDNVEEQRIGARR
jgi:hypothetical protein